MAIPCNISHQNARHTSPISPPLNGTFAHTSSGAASDGAHLILWYRGEDISGSPLYTVDGRDIGPKSASSQRNDDPTTGSSLRHFVGPELTGRARVNLASRPAMLLIDAIDAADSGTYWCRVDYRWTRTLISMVQLHVHGTFLCNYSMAKDSTQRTPPSSLYLHPILKQLTNKTVGFSLFFSVLFR